MFGLREVLQTKVGNDYVRGVSGGQRKRVSIAEALAARAAIYCWDNATRGLDSSTALEYTHAIRSATNVMGNVGIVAIYQAGQRIYDLFDKVTVFYSGRQIYFGSTENAKDYFERMGYQCPPRQTTAEFLTAITDPLGRVVQPGFENKVPTTADEFELYWRNSPEFQKLRIEIDEYNSVNKREYTIERFEAANKSERMKRQRPKSRYLINFTSQLKLVIIRGINRVKGDMAYTIISVCSSIFQALIIGSLFYNISNSTSGAFSRGGAIFFTLLYNALASLAEVNSFFVNRPILLKQRSYSFYHPSAEAIQSVLSDLPVKLTTITLFCIIIYFLTDLNQTAGQFFFFLLLVIITSNAVSALFQMIAAWCKTVDVANSISGVVVLVISVYTGYMIPLRSMHPWFKWLNWLNPIRYGFESLMANEFHGVTMPCANIIPRGPDYQNLPSTNNQVCAFSGNVPGEPFYVSGDRYIQVAYSYSWSHAWRNFGIVVAFFLAFYVVNCIGTELIKPMASGADVLLFIRGKIPEDLHEEKQASTETNVNSEAYIKEQIESLGAVSSDPDIFSWQNLSYSVPVKGGTRTLLDNVQGYVKPGTMTALMGESGAGKTTLLNVLSQRVDIGVVTGDMLINGIVAKTDASFKRRTGYVQQQDLHLAESTVREALQFAARLRQPAHVPDAEKMEYVEKIINILGMEKYSEALVGQVGRGLNVEQRKKLSIGVELVAKPSLLLFLDEPTSGLDSQSSWAILSFMKQLAHAGQSILCTIHQPSATLFEQFDRLLLLKRGGRMVYFGDIGPNSSILLDYFESNGSRPCGRDENPAEYILECIGAGATATAEKDWGDVWAASPQAAALTQEIDQLHEHLRATKGSQEHGTEDKHIHQKYATPYFTQLKHVLKRTQLQFWRSPNYIMGKLFLMMAGGLFIGFTFWKIDNSVAGLQNGMFGIFLIQIIASPLCNQIENFAEQSRDLYEARESASNTFHWSALLISQYLSELPYHFVFSTILFIAFYFPIGYERDATTAGYFYFIYCVLFQLYYTSFALMIIYASPDSSSSAVITSLLFSFMIAFCGVFQPVSQMPGFWTFMYKVSPYTYFIQSYMLSVFHERPVICQPMEFNRFAPPSGMTCGEYMQSFLQQASGYIQNPSATDICEYCQYSVGDEYLASVGNSYSYKWRNVGFICAYIVFNFFAMVLLYYLFRVKSWKIPDFGRYIKMSGKKTRSSVSCKNKSSEEEYMQQYQNDQNNEGLRMNENGDMYALRPEDVQYDQRVEALMRQRSRPVEMAAPPNPPINNLNNTSIS